jgi:hypothetical protein
MQFPRAHRLTLARVGNDDVAETPLEIFEIGGQAEDCHHLRRNRDVKAGFARIAVGNTTERTDDLAQRAIVHIHHAAPSDAAGVDTEGIAPVDVIVDQR